MTGQIIYVPWNSETITVHSSTAAIYYQFEPWLKSNVGRKHVDWHLSIDYYKGVEIKFRRGKGHLAFEATLIYCHNNANY